jgi:hypothetical protein
MNLETLRPLPLSPGPGAQQPQLPGPRVAPSPHITRRVTPGHGRKLRPVRS